MPHLLISVFKNDPIGQLQELVVCPDVEFVGVVNEADHILLYSFNICGCKLVA